MLEHIHVEIKDVARLKVINWQFVEVCNVVCNVFDEQNVVPVLTGASYEDYPAGSDHAMGLAWDWRIWDLVDVPLAVGRIYLELFSVSDAFYVLYGDPDHIDHFHVGYNPDYRKSR